MASITYADLVDRALDQADLKNSEHAEDTDAYRWVQTYLEEVWNILIQTYEDYFIDIHTFNLTNGEEKYVYPNDLISLKAVYYRPESDPNFRQKLKTFSMKDLEYLSGSRSGYAYALGWYNTINAITLKYRLIGPYIYFAPKPLGGEEIELWYVRRFPKFVSESTIIDIPVNVEWEDYVICKTAERLLIQEESDASEVRRLANEAKSRLITFAENRDSGKYQKITDEESYAYWDEDY